MQHGSRPVGLILLMFGFISLFSSLGKPRIQPLHGSDILGLMASGACFGVAIVGLLGRLRIRDE
jgi:hypothetical protein